MLGLLGKKTGNDSFTTHDFVTKELINQHKNTLKHNNIGKIVKQNIEVKSVVFHIPLIEPKVVCGLPLRTHVNSLNNKRRERLMVHGSMIIGVVHHN